MWQECSAAMSEPGHALGAPSKGIGVADVARLRHSFAGVAAIGQMSLLNIGAYSVLFRATKRNSLVGTYKI